MKALVYDGPAQRGRNSLPDRAIVDPTEIVPLGGTGHTNVHPELAVVGAAI